MLSIVIIRLIDLEELRTRWPGPAAAVLLLFDPAEFLGTDFVILTCRKLSVREMSQFRQKTKQNYTSTQSWCYSCILVWSDFDQRAWWLSRAHRGCSSL